MAALAKAHSAISLAIAAHGLALLFFPKELLSDVYGVKLSGEVRFIPENSMVVFALNRLGALQTALGLLLASRRAKSWVVPAYLAVFAAVLFNGPALELNVDTVVAGCLTLAIIALCVPSGASGESPKRVMPLNDSMRKLLSVLALGFEVAAASGHEFFELRLKLTPESSNIMELCRMALAPTLASYFVVMWLDLGIHSHFYFLVDALLHLFMAYANSRVFTDYGGIAKIRDQYKELTRSSAPKPDLEQFAQMARVHFALFLIVLTSWLREWLRRG